MSFEWYVKPKTKAKADVWIMDYSFIIYNSTFAMKKPCKCFDESTKKGDPECTSCEGSGKLFMKNKDGQVVGGCFGVLDQVVKKLYEGYKVISAFDPPKGDLYRTKLLDTYKGNRSKPDFIQWQMDYGQQLLNQIPAVDCYTSDIHESDDIMATLALQYANEGHRVIVSSDDKDMLPLLGHPNIAMFRQKNFFTSKDFYAKYGFPPERFNEYLAICGDSADNFNFFKGLGDSAAKYLINEYKHISHVYNDWHNIPPKYQKCLAKLDEKGNVVKHLKDEMDLALKIASLRTDVECIPTNKEFNEEDVNRQLDELGLTHIRKHMHLLSRGTNGS